MIKPRTALMQNRV